MANLPDESKLKFQMSSRMVMLCVGLIVVGLILIALQVITFQPQKAGDHNSRLWMSLHLALLVGIPMALGGVYFAAFNHVAGAAWSVTMRRIAETHVWFLPVMMVLMGVILFVGIGDVFHHWFGVVPGTDHLIDHKRAWLWAINSKDPVKDKGFILMSFEWRNMLFIALWFVLGFFLWKASVSQDQHGEVSTTRRLARLSAIFLVVFGVSYSASSWDLSMSLEPHWFSTMWAVYIFAGLALTTFALLILWIWYLKGKGYYGESINENHWHDLGKFMWGHTIFWAYIGVSQFILIWYAHIPEETTFYHYRLYQYVDGELVYSAWGFVSLFLAIIRFILPFFLIIKRESKRKLNYLAAVAALVIFGQVVDMYWIAYPTLLKGSKFVMFSWQELGPLFLLAGSYILVVGYFLTRTSLIPRKDPRLEECLHWHQ